LKSIVAAVRWVYDFDGIDDRGAFAYRAINIDGVIDIEWEQDFDAIGSKVIVSQCGDGQNITQEFRLTHRSDGVLELILGGSVHLALTQAQGMVNKARYRLLLVGSEGTLYKDDVIIRTATFTRGPAREPSAVTLIASRPSGSGFTNYGKGRLSNIKINGTLWPIAENNQTIQLPLPAGLGAERANFNIVTVQAGWTYNNGTFTATSVPAFQPSSGFSIGALTAGEAYFLELEVLSVTGTFRVQVTGGTGQNLVPNITSPGKYRFLVVALAGNTSCGFQATVNNTSCVINEISFKPLGTCNPLTLVNTTPDRWQEVPL
jgi:hypothetical protein